MLIRLRNILVLELFYIWSNDFVVHPGGKLGHTVFWHRDLTLFSLVFEQLGLLHVTGALWAKLDASHLNLKELLMGQWPIVSIVDGPPVDLHRSFV
jgi:hypothetical protein